MKTKPLWALLLLIFPMATTADTASQVTYLANPSCGEWIQQGASTIQGELNHTYLAGLMSGIAVGTISNFLAKTDTDSVFLWMDNYCRAHPLDKLIDGGIKLAGELSKK